MTRECQPERELTAAEFRLSSSCTVRGPCGSSRREWQHREQQVYTTFMLQSHKQAMAAIKSARQRVEKATQDRDKAKEKLKKAQARLAAEKEQLRKSQEKLES